jgi:hypothetical protein
VAFKFKLHQCVKIKVSGETGTVIGRAEYADSKPNYLIRYAAGDGRAVESWWAASALEACGVGENEEA